MANERFYQGIEDKAGFYPSRYYGGLLTFHNAVFETADDSLAADYVPLTTTKLRSRTEILPFVIGILPPSSVPSGRLLTRDLSTSQQTPPATHVSPAPTPKPGPNLPAPPGADQVYNPIQKKRFKEYEEYRRQGKYKKTAGGRNSDWPGMWANTGDYNVAHAKDPGRKHQGVDLSTEKGTPLIAAWGGKVVRVRNTPTGGNNFRLQFEKEGKKWDMYYAHMDSMYVQEGQEVAAGEVIGTVGNTGNARDTEAHLHLEVYIDGQQVDPYKHMISSVPVEGGAVPGDANSSDFATAGSKNAQAAAQSQAQTAGKKLNGSTSLDPDQGAAYTAAQSATIKAIQDAAFLMENTPPLQLLINPESFSVSNQKIISDGNWGRNGSGTGIEHWGDAQDTISASGRVAGFFAQQSQGVNGSSGNSPGLTRMARNFSMSYENLLSLYLIYRNNGALWIPDNVDARDAQTVKPNMIATVGSVYIYYDSTLYIGSFDSFQLTEDDTAPFTLSYSFEFTVRATYLLDRVGNENPNPGTDYGAPGFFQPGPQASPVNVTPGPAPTSTVSPPPGGANVPVPSGTQVSQSNDPWAQALNNASPQGDVSFGVLDNLSGTGFGASALRGNSGIIPLNPPTEVKPPK